MKRIAIALLIVLMAASAQAATIFDIQNGVFAEGDLVDLSGVVVTAVRSGGVYVAEAPYGPYNGIWCYGQEGFVVGDVLDIVGGEYTEYYDLSEVLTADATVTLVGSGTVVEPYVVDAATLFGDPEPYESCLVKVSDGMMVSSIGDYGMWFADANDGTVVTFDDYFFDDTTVLVGDCYNSVVGIMDYSYSEWKLHPLEDGVELVDCTVATEAVNLESIKALYR